MKAKMPHKRDRGQVGIGTLIVFIAMVLVAAIAAGVLINTAGFLQSQSEQTGQQSSAQVSDRLQVINTVGENISEVGDTSVRQIGVINMTVSKAPGANDIDLETLTLQYVSDEKIVNLVANESEVVEDDRDAGTDRRDVFHVATIQDDDQSIANSTVINDPADRATLILSLVNNSKVESSGNPFNSYNATAVGPINESSDATIQLTTQAGGETTVTITVPDSLTGKDAVEL
jgi:flagellin FlaB